MSIHDKDLFPHLHLLVSGGNSQILFFDSWKEWRIIGQTLDDAAGECMDKTGRMLGLPYPAGISVAKIAKMDDKNYLDLPIGMQRGNNSNFNYSFSGLKTAMRYLIEKQDIEGYYYEKPLLEEEIEELKRAEKIEELKTEKLRFIYQACCSIQSVVTHQLINKLSMAIEQHSPQSLGLSGGVSANLLLRQKMENLKRKKGVKHLFIPQLKLTGDNAVMIGLAGLASLY
jgi:N6-L-threonylcarbamoyladenine synthase